MKCREASERADVPTVLWTYPSMGRVGSGHVDREDRRETSGESSS